MFRDLPTRLLEASVLQESLRSVSVRLIEASELQTFLRSFTEIFDRATVLEMERLHRLVSELVSTASELYATQVQDLARGISEAATLQVATTFPSADMPVVTIPYQPRPASMTLPEVVYVPQEQEGGSLLKKIAKHPLSDLASKLAALIAVAYVVADHHPQIFAWMIDELLRTAGQLLQYMD
jgi:hypothetical protein